MVYFKYKISPSKFNSSPNKSTDKWTGVKTLSNRSQRVILAQIHVMSILGLCDNENCYITIMQLIIMIIMIAMLDKIHLGIVIICTMLE